MDEQPDMDDYPDLDAVEWCRANDATIRFCHKDPNYPVVVTLPAAPTGVSPTGYGKTIEESVRFLHERQSQSDFAWIKERIKFLERRVERLEKRDDR